MSDEKPIKVFPFKTSNKDPNEILKEIEADPVLGPELKSFTERCDQYHKDVREHVIKGLSSEEVKKFDFWWNGGSIGDQKAWEEFWTKYPKAYSAIMAATSAGCG
jgi:hypothetical protein